MKGDVSAREILRSRGCSCVVVRPDGVRTADGIGVKPLMSFLREDPGFFAGACVADKVIGKAAAMLLAAGGAVDVYGQVMSEAAVRVLQEAGIAYAYGDLVPYIRNRTGDGLCPLEEAVQTLRDPSDAFAVLERRIAELMSASAHDKPLSP